MAADSVFRGTFTALVTPFSESGDRIDYDSLRDLIEFQIEAGVDGLVLCGSTGEAATLSDSEFSEIVPQALSFVRGRVPMVVGVGSNNTARAADMASALNDHAIAGILLVAPPYNKPPQAGIVAHFKAVKARTKHPIVAYNVPGRTSVNIAPETYAALTQDGVIAAIKEANGGLTQVLDTVALIARKVPILSGEDALIHATMASGGAGVISVISNVWPKQTLAITATARAERWEESLQAQLKVLPLVRAMFCETNPIPVKMAAALRGIIRHPTLRLPLVLAQPATVERIKLLLTEFA